MQDADSVTAFVQHVIFNVPDLVPSPDQEYIHTLSSWSTEVPDQNTQLHVMVQLHA